MNTPAGESGLGPEIAEAVRRLEGQASQPNLHPQEWLVIRLDVLKPLLAELRRVSLELEFANARIVERNAEIARLSAPVAGTYPTAKPLAERYWSKVVVNEDGCWGWNGNLTTAGYGYMPVTSPGTRQTTIGAHRISYEIHKGPIPEGLFVLHRCDNPPCTNPEHLFLGTPKDNMQDMARKGRSYSAHGETSSRSILTNEQAREILLSPMPSFLLAKKYGVAQETVSGIKRGSRYTLATAGLEPVKSEPRKFPHAKCLNCGSDWASNKKIELFCGRPECQKQRSIRTKNVKKWDKAHQLT